MHGKSLVVIGGGAAGFFCAVNAARIHTGLRVTVVEKSSKILSKVKVSGGGRCNVTHACYDIDTMSRNYPRGQSFVKKAFHQFFTTDTIRWFEERGVKVKEERDGRMFPLTDSSQTIIDCLVSEANLYGVEIRYNVAISEATFDNDKWTLETESGTKIQADYVCIACGGYPKSSQFDWLRKLGHEIESPVPSLFTFNMPGHPVTKLMGISVEQARVKISGKKLQTEGPLLITHWGMSGPAILKMSAMAARELAADNYNFTAIINWLPDLSEEQLRERFRQFRQELASQKIYNRNPFGLPQRLWEYLLQQVPVKAEMRWADFPVKEQNRLIHELYAGSYEVKGKTTFKEEFVTAGGIKLSEVDHNKMASKKWPRLFFAGEILDVDAVTGGFNFQFAWTSGFIVANNLAAGS